LGYSPTPASIDIDPEDFSALMLTFFYFISSFRYFPSSRNTGW